MARSLDIVAGVADLNLKHFADNNVAQSQLSMSDSLDHRRRSQVLAESNVILGQALTTRAAKDIVTLDTAEASAMKEVVGAGVPDSISALQAAVATMAMQNKTVALSPPK